MCNACNNMCCGSDQFEKCGCEFCGEPACWDDDDDDRYEPDDDGEAYAARPRFACVAIAK
jgi:hypothetical protein